MCHFIIIRSLPLNESALAQRGFNGSERRARPICFEVSGRGVGTAWFVGAGAARGPPRCQHLAATRAPLWERGWHPAHPSVHPMSSLGFCTPQRTHPQNQSPPHPKTGHAEQASPARNDVSLFSDGKEGGRKGCTAAVQNNRWGGGQWRRQQPIEGTPSPRPLCGCGAAGPEARPETSLAQLNGDEEHGGGCPGGEGGVF